MQLQDTPGFHKYYRVCGGAGSAAERDVLNEDTVRGAYLGGGSAVLLEVQSKGTPGGS